MSKQKVIVLAVTVQGLSATETARRYGVSRRWVHELLNRHRDGGMEPLEPRSRRPNSNPRSTGAETAARILAIRAHLTEAGLDAGPITIAWHLEREGLHPPSSSTIRRILHTHGLIRPEPKKRPKASLHRLEAHQPNETWQSDFTHWALADRTDIETERFHQTLKRWLAGQPRAHTPEDLNEQLAKFRHIYNHERPHRALDRRTPATACTATPKAVPAGARRETTGAAA